MSRSGSLFAGLIGAALAVGCGGGVEEEVIQVKASNDPLFEPRSILQRYAQGQPLGSEVTSFPYMVENVRKVDPERAEILEKGFEELQKASPGARPAKAKELLAKIQPSMNPMAEQAPEEAEQAPADG